MTTTRHHRGLTLIELMIVVTILAILAAVVIPRYSSANDDAKSSSLASQLHTVNKALFLYKTDHNDNYPTNAQMITNQWQVLVNKTDIDGDVSGSDYGPYFLQPPMNAFKDSSVVAADNSAAWLYDASAGRVQAVVQQSIYDRAAELKLDPADLVVEP